MIFFFSYFNNFYNNPLASFEIHAVELCLRKDHFLENVKFDKNDTHGFFYALRENTEGALSTLNSLQTELKTIIKEIVIKVLPLSISNIILMKRKDFH